MIEWIQEMLLKLLGRHTGFTFQIRSYEAYDPGFPFQSLPQYNLK